MNWFHSTTAKIVAGCIALIGLQGYQYVSTRNSMDRQMGSLSQQMESARAEDNAKVAQLSSDIDVITSRMGITAQQLTQARNLAEQLKQENARTAQRLRNELAAKADSKTVTEYREEAATKLAEVQQDASSKIGAVSGDVQVVRTDLSATRDELAASRKDITDVRTEIAREIARNATELADLRRKGERNYVEFDMNKTNQYVRIGDVQFLLKKTDPKRQKYSVMIQADDNRIEKKDRLANEPILFLVGRDRLRYEFVVNYVDKDRIRGYMSTPKDKVLAAEGPSSVQHPN